MPIRYTATANVEPLDQLDAFFDQFEDVAYSEFEDTVNDNHVSILDELRTEPPQRSYPSDYPNGQLPFVSERQRRWYWANIGEPHKRTGALANAWVLEVERGGGNFFMVIENPSSAARWVYGSLAVDVSAALRFQQPFHAATGWQVATETVQFWVNAVMDDYTERMKRIGKTVFKGRAFTR